MIIQVGPEFKGYVGPYETSSFINSHTMHKDKRTAMIQHNIVIHAQSFGLGTQSKYCDNARLCEVVSRRAIGKDARFLFANKDSKAALNP